jgi:hypothetical protein
MHKRCPLTGNGYTSRSILAPDKRLERTTTPKGRLDGTHSPPPRVTTRSLRVDIKHVRLGLDNGA